MWGETERSRVVGAPGSNNFGDLIASSTSEKNGSEACNFQCLSEEDANELCKRYLRLAYKIARQYRERGIGLPELRSAACRGLFKASRKFDPSKGVSFGPHARPWIKGEITALFKQLRRDERGKLSLNVPAFADDEQSPSKLDLVHDASLADGLLRHELNQAIERGGLTEIERQIVVQRLLGANLTEIGKNLSRSAERVRQIESRAIAKVRDAFDGSMSDLVRRDDVFQPETKPVPSLRAGRKWKWSKEALARCPHLKDQQDHLFTPGPTAKGYAYSQQEIEHCVALRPELLTPQPKKQKRFYINSIKQIRWKKPLQTKAEKIIIRQGGRKVERLGEISEFEVGVRALAKTLQLNKPVRMPIPGEPKPVVELECYQNECLRENIPRTYEPNLSKQLQHHRKHAARLEAVRGNAPLGRPNGPVSYSWGHP